MISKPCQAALFIVAGVITFLFSRTFEPGPQPAMAEMREKTPVITPPTSWTRDQINARLDAVRNASTPAAQLDACLDLSEIPAADVPDLLEQMKSEISRNFSLEAQTLLIRWASADGEAAANWAWRSFRSGTQWNNAFTQIGPTWATHNPSALGKWAIQTAKRKPGSWHETLTLAQAEASDTPLLDGDFLPKIPEWLVTESPHAAYEVILATDPGSGVNKLVYSLTSLSAVQEALLACNEATDPDGKKHNRITEIKDSVLRRWFELDPEGFNQSPYAGNFTIWPIQVTTSIQARWDSWPETERIGQINHLLSKVAPKYQKEAITRMAAVWAKTDPTATVRWLDSLPPDIQDSTSLARINTLAPQDLTATLDWAEKLPAGQRRDAIIPAYDAWTLAHPGQEPDQNGWSAARVAAWEDLRE